MKRGDFSSMKKLIICLIIMICAVDLSLANSMDNPPVNGLGAGPGPDPDPDPDDCCPEYLEKIVPCIDYFAGTPSQQFLLNGETISFPDAKAKVVIVQKGYIDNEEIPISPPPDLCDNFDTSICSTPIIRTNFSCFRTFTTNISWPTNELVDFEPYDVINEVVMTHHCEVPGSKDFTLTASFNVRAINVNVEFEPWLQRLFDGTPASVGCSNQLNPVYAIQPPTNVVVTYEFENLSQSNLVVENNNDVVIRGAGQGWLVMHVDVGEERFTHRLGNIFTGGGGTYGIYPEDLVFCGGATQSYHFVSCVDSDGTSPEDQTVWTLDGPLEVAMFDNGQRSNTGKTVCVKTLAPGSNTLHANGFSVGISVEEPCLFTVPQIEGKNIFRWNAEIGPGVPEGPRTQVTVKRAINIRGIEPGNAQSNFTRAETNSPLCWFSDGIQLFNYLWYLGDGNQYLSVSDESVRPSEDKPWWSKINYRINTLALENTNVCLTASGLEIVPMEQGTIFYKCARASNQNFVCNGKMHFGVAAIDLDYGEANGSPQEPWEISGGGLVQYATNFNIVPTNLAHNPLFTLALLPTNLPKTGFITLSSDNPTLFRLYDVHTNLVLSEQHPSAFYVVSNTTLPETPLRFYAEGLQRGRVMLTATYLYTDVSPRFVMTDQVGFTVEYADADRDGLSDWLEQFLGANPNNSDTDDDGMPDGWEYDNGYDPTLDEGPSRNDPDGDELNNYQESLQGTDPKKPDTDSDGMPDGWEVQYDLCPLLHNANWDKDGDRLSNFEEYGLRSEPNNTSTKSVPDIWLVKHWKHINVDLRGDADRDGLTNLQEFRLGTDPRDDNTDGDGFSDKFENDAGGANRGPDPLAYTWEEQGYSCSRSVVMGSYPVAPNSGAHVRVAQTDVNISLPAAYILADIQALTLDCEVLDDAIMIDSNETASFNELGRKDNFTENVLSLVEDQKSGHFLIDLYDYCIYDSGNCAEFRGTFHATYSMYNNVSLQLPDYFGIDATLGASPGGSSATAEIMLSRDEKFQSVAWELYGDTIEFSGSSQSANPVNLRSTSQPSAFCKAETVRATLSFSDNESFTIGKGTTSVQVDIQMDEHSEVDEENIQLDTPGVSHAIQEFSIVLLPDDLARNAPYDYLNLNAVNCEIFEDQACSILSPPSYTLKNLPQILYARFPIGENATILATHMESEARDKVVFRSDTVVKVEFTKVWSDQFPYAVANYLPGGSGRKGYDYLLMGARAIDRVYAKAEVSIQPDTPEIRSKLLFNFAAHDGNSYVLWPENNCYLQGNTVTAEAARYTNLEQFFIAALDLNNYGVIDNEEVIEASEYHFRSVWEQRYNAHLAVLKNAANSTIGGLFLPITQNHLREFCWDYGSIPGAGSTDDIYSVLENSLDHNVGIMFNSNSEGPIVNHQYSSQSQVAEKFYIDTEMSERIKQTLYPKNSEVRAFFASSSENTNTFVWPIIEPRFVPAQTDLRNAFGEVRLNDTYVAVTVVRDNYSVQSIRLYGTVNDFYDFDIEDTTFNPISQLVVFGARVQAGYGTLGEGGHVFRLQVNLDTTYTDFDFNF